MPRHEYFINRSRQAPAPLIVPDTPLYLANNCDEGKYYLGDVDCGDDLQLVALLLSKRISTNDYAFAKAGALLGQLWFTPVSGSDLLPGNLVYHTILTSSMMGSKGSLANFVQQIAVAMSRGYDYREVIWSPRFARKSSYRSFSLVWEWREPTTEELRKLDSCVAVLESEVSMGKLRDSVVETTTLSIDGMNQDEVEQLARRYR